MSSCRKLINVKVLAIQIEVTQTFQIVSGSKQPNLPTIIYASISSFTSQLSFLSSGIGSSHENEVDEVNLAPSHSQVFCAILSMIRI